MPGTSSKITNYSSETSWKLHTNNKNNQNINIQTQTQTHKKEVDNNTNKEESKNNEFEDKYGNIFVLINGKLVNKKELSIDNTKIA